MIISDRQSWSLSINKVISFHTFFKVTLQLTELNHPNGDRFFKFHSLHFSQIYKFSEKIDMYIFTNIHIHQHRLPKKLTGSKMCIFFQLRFFNTPCGTFIDFSRCILSGKCAHVTRNLHYHSCVRRIENKTAPIERTNNKLDSHD
jgi:hypothetical protein